MEKWERVMVRGKCYYCGTTLDGGGYACIRCARTHLIKCWCKEKRIVGTRHSKPIYAIVARHDCPNCLGQGCFWVSEPNGRIIRLGT